MKKIISCLALTILFFACKKTELPVQTDQESVSEPSSAKGGTTSPTVTTNAASFLTSATATSGGTVSTSGGGSTVTERGLCFNTSPNPTIANFKITSGSGAGSFTSILSGLNGSTTYYVRAYATKSTGTTYGNQVSFTTLQSYGTVTDVDGNIYGTINIGGQIWMTENLKVTKYRDNTPIPLVTDNTEWAELSTGAYCNYNNDEVTAAVYSKLYNWWAATDSRNIAPEGYHVPSYAEWQTLQTYLGGANEAGGRAKDLGLAHWNDPNITDNASGFSAFGGGARFVSSLGIGSGYYEFHSHGNWWATNSYPYITMENNNTLMYRSSSPPGGYANGNKRQGNSIRCIRD